MLIKTPQIIPHQLFSGQELHLWITRDEEIQSPELIEAYHDLLSEEELAQQKRFLRAKDRHQYLITRALVRTTLSRYYPVPPKEWNFSKNRYGRPELASQPPTHPLFFNLSHSKGFVVCLIGTHPDIGVDVESMQRLRDPILIADRFFSDFEQKALYQLPKERQRFRFFQYWTLGEAYIKARGMGLAIPLHQFSFHLDEGEEISISFGPEILDQPPLWQFEQMTLSSQHLLAVALKHPTPQKLPIKWQEVIPPTC